MLVIKCEIEAMSFSICKSRAPSVIMLGPDYPQVRFWNLNSADEAYHILNINDIVEQVNKRSLLGRIPEE